MPGNPLDDRSVAATLGQPSDPASVTPTYSAPVAPPAALTTITPEEALASLPNALETSLDGLVVLDIEGRSRLLYANAAARTLLSLPEEDEGAEAGRLLSLPEEDEGAEAGRAFPRLFTPRERPAIAAHLSSVCDGAGRGAGSGGWLSILADVGGAERVVECVPRLVIAGRGRVVSVSLRDVTEARRLARRASALARVAANVTYAGSLKDTLTQLTRDSVLAAHYAIGIEPTDEVINIFEDVTARMEAEGRLREREAQYRGIFEATSDGLVITDRRNVVVDVNPAFCRMHGRTRDEFIGQSESIFIHPSRYTAVDESLRAIDERGAYQTEGLDLRGDGRPFPVEVHATSFAYRNEPHILSVVRDITEQAQARALLERRVSTRTQELSTLLDVAHTVAATLELQPLLDLILDHLKSVVDYTGASINSIENDSLVVLQRRGPVPSDPTQPWRFPLASAPAIWEIMYRGEPVIIDDVHADTRLAAQYRAVDGQRLETDLGYVRTWMGVPLMLKDRLIGSLTLVSGTIGAYGARDVTLARALAALAAVAIENARLYEQARRIAALEERQRLSRELHDSVSQALYGIALGARTARALIDRDPGKAVEPLDSLTAPLDYVLSLAEAGLAEMRALIFELRPEALERDGLVVALERQAEAARARHNLVIEANLGAEPDAPYAIKEALYRIAREALHNAGKHARARTIRLRLSSTPRAGGDGIAALELDVEDDGIGFDPGDEYPGHLGLRTMRERAEAFGGVFEIASRPGHGVRLHALVPIDKAGY